MQANVIDIFLTIAILIFVGITLWLLDYNSEEQELSIETLVSPKPKFIVRREDQQKSLANKMIGRIRDLDKETSRKKVKRDKTSHEMAYYGQARLPERIYEGDSRNIVIGLHPDYEPVNDQRNAVQYENEKDGIALNLRVPSGKESDEYLELELVAAGITIEGDKKQKQLLNADVLFYQWNCHFQNSGTYAFLIVVRATNSRETIQVGYIEGTIKVVKLDHLTQRQVWTWTTVAGCISGILTIIEILRRLNIL